MLHEAQGSANHLEDLAVLVALVGSILLDRRKWRKGEVKKEHSDEGRVAWPLLDPSGTLTGTANQSQLRQPAHEL